MLTLGQILLQNRLQICRTCFSYSLELLGVHDLQARAHIASIVSEIDHKALVTKDGLLIAEDGICHLRVEGVQSLEASIAWSDEGDVDGIVGFGGPYEAKS